MSDGLALADLLPRAERDPGFPGRLEAQCAARAVLFRSDREREALGRLVDALQGNQPLLAS